MPSLDRCPLPDLGLINTRHYCSMAIQYSRGWPSTASSATSLRYTGAGLGRSPWLKSSLNWSNCIAANGEGRCFLWTYNFIGNKNNVKQLLLALAEWNDGHRRPFTFFTEGIRNGARNDSIPPGIEPDAQSGCRSGRIDRRLWNRTGSNKS